MKILLTNDDGIHAVGLEALVRELEPEHECLVAAPASERSASSHSISLGQKLVIEEMAPGRYAIHGTPADCVKLALSEIKYFKPDLLISGINPGPNTGVSVYYSGTISAAREALINQLSGIAVSIRSKTPSDYSFAASFCHVLIEGYASKVFPQNVILNVNLPDLPESKIRGIKIARQAPSRFVEEFIVDSVHENKRIYRLAGEIQVFDPDGTTDEEVCAKGFIAITPLKLDATCYTTVPLLEKWLTQRQHSWQRQKSI